MYNRFSRVGLVIFVVVILIYYTLYDNKETSINVLENEQINSTIKQEISYLINTSQCRIPKSNPYSKDIIDLISTENYLKCLNKPLLTYINKTNDIVTLHLNNSAKWDYSFFDIKCCYSNITRVNYKKLVDDKIKLTDCIPFEDSIQLSFPYVSVKCSTIFSEVYSNVHAITFPVSKEYKKLIGKPKFSIMLLGIDSMSKSNIERTMPETFKFAEKNMVNLKGYNKIGDNTFPNLMAILSGYSMEQLKTFCNRTTKLNNCRIIWDKFKKSHYVTGYAEDDCNINTFQYDRPGFSEEPTDYYYRPYFLAAESLSVVMRKNMIYCAGPETSGERILNAAKDFAITFRDVPSFGLFWSNSYSHDNINMPHVMDESMLEFLSNTQFREALNNTVFIFFSDHGFRFGNIRYTHTGWLEERLPFIYFKFPDLFKRTYAEEYNNFIINTNRLTSPYDIHNTLQYILKISNNSYMPSWSVGCPSSQHLFAEIPENRTCKDAGISLHWCTCKGHTYIKPNHPKVQEISRFVVSEINSILQRIDEDSLCEAYTLNKVTTSGVSEPYVNEEHQYVHFFLVMVQTSPKASFEATVEAPYDETDKRFKILGDISRIDSYDSVTRCIRNYGHVKKYCHCKDY